MTSFFPQNYILHECKPEWNREAITVFSRLPSLVVSTASHVTYYNLPYLAPFCASQMSVCTDLLCMHSHTCSHMSHSCVCTHTWSQLILCSSVRCITKRSRPRQPRRETLCLSPASAQPGSPEDCC